MESDSLNLVSQAKHGNKAAIGQLYDQYVRSIYRFVWFKTQHREVAEDITAQVFVRVIEKLAQYDERKGPFAGWLYGIARRAVADHYRSIRPTQPIEDAWSIGANDLLENIDVKLLSAELQGALTKLTPLQRDVMVMRVWQELSYAEIAAALGKSEGACKMAFVRGVDSMRPQIIPLLIFFLTLRL